ncbi:nitrate regulatory gene2 protein-like [Telopea speciosissima]|uniref:nitrate regulatory gene2 protein-like n=1 Tax=Telopea speciosissima TaxID=54955 RepID=UPI001CC72E4F|nr:nitrate regulatory gene2 protein-like [Telopea speciosissima]XP_043725208.1 nitrate regulatory gene2 protein-like [Telopea speciosissima]
MGCTQSKIENEEAVGRCKDRKKYMRDAVSARNAFAAAHSAYTVTLKNTGAALSDYGQGEVNDPRPSQPPVQPPIETIRPPPPPNYTPPLQRAASMPSKISIPNSEPKSSEPIQEEDEEAEIDDNADLIHRGSARIPETPQPPPSPPLTPPTTNPNTPLPPQSGGTPFDYFFSVEVPGSSLGDPDDIRPDTYDDRYHRKENVFVDDDHVGSNGGVVEPQTPEELVEPTAVNSQPSKKLKQVVNSQAAPPVEAKRVGKAARNVNLLEILNQLDDHFLKAFESAHDVSKMLEANRLHYHSNFADNRGHIDHSAKVMRVITWNRSFRGMLNTDDGKDDFDREEHDTHATVLDKLLAWEKKLYDEVKAGELMKLEYQRKVALLNKRKKRGTNSEALEKTKAAVSHLHTRYIVDMQSLDSTVAEINRLRDDRLYPKLVELVDGLAEMWETIYIHHDKQVKISQDLRSLDLSLASKETSKHHYDRTVQLCSVVQEWHTQFQKLVTHQKEYIRALNSWLKLNLIPIESSLKEKVSSPPRVPQPPIQGLLLAWNDNLEKLPDEIARTPISSFAAMVKTVILHQEEEFKLKERIEETRKELARKERAFTEWREKYMQRKTPTDEMETERTEDGTYNDPIVERQFAVDVLQKRLEEEVEAHQKHSRHVREKSLQNLKLHLPELFHALSNFAHDCSGMYKNLRAVAEGELD